MPDDTRAGPSLSLPVARQAVIVSAHPGDALAACGGLVQRLLAEGRELDLLTATDGPGCRPASPAALLEADAEAHRRLGLASSAHVRLHLPDGQLAGYGPVLGHHLAERLTIDTLCLAPWSHDPDADHAALAEVALVVALSLGAPLLRYLPPLSASDGPAPAGVQTLALTPGEVAAKAAALATLGLGSDGCSSDEAYLA